MLWWLTKLLLFWAIYVINRLLLCIFFPLITLYSSDLFERHNSGVGQGCQWAMGKNKEIFHPLVRSSDVHIGWGWAGPGWGQDLTLHLDLPYGGRDPHSWASFYCFTRSVIREWNREWNTGESKLLSQKS